VSSAPSASDLRSQSTAISDGIGAMHREHYGRGADRIRTTIHPEHAITVLEGCFTPVERRMVSEGAFGQVRETRITFQGRDRRRGRALRRRGSVRVSRRRR
jgi:uncharacterized protein YbcI